MFDLPQGLQSIRRRLCSEMPDPRSIGTDFFGGCARRCSTRRWVCNRFFGVLAEARPAAGSGRRMVRGSSGDWVNPASSPCLLLFLSPPSSPLSLALRTCLLVPGLFRPLSRLLSWRSAPPSDTARILLPTSLSFPLALKPNVSSSPPVAGAPSRGPSCVASPGTENGESEKRKQEKKHRR